MSLSAIRLPPSVPSYREEYSLLRISHHPDVFPRLSEMLPGGGAELLLVNKNIKSLILSMLRSLNPEVKLHLMALAKQPLIDRVEVLQEEIREAEEREVLASEALRAFRQDNQYIIGLRESLPCLRFFPCFRGKFQRFEVLSGEQLQSRELLDAKKEEQNKVGVDLLA